MLYYILGTFEVCNPALCSAFHRSYTFSAETWWVNSLARDPILIPYKNGLRRLDKVYLDTTFATKEDIYRRFPTKADGIQELLTKVTAYPKDTVFYFNSWTFGYEDVWRSLASVLDSQVHLTYYHEEPTKLMCILDPCGQIQVALIQGACQMLQCYHCSTRRGCTLRLPMRQYVSTRLLDRK